MLDCILRFGDAVCEEGALVGNRICDSDMQRYRTCVAPPTEDP